MKVEQQNVDQAMTDAGDEPGDDHALARQMTVFCQYADRLTRRIAAIERALEDRRASEPPP